MKPSFLFFYMIGLYLQVSGQTPHKEMLQKIQGLWVEEQYMACIMSQKSPQQCAYNKNLDLISVYIPPQSGASDTLWFSSSSLHIHDMLYNETDEEELRPYHYRTQVPAQIPSQRYLTNDIEYFSDSTHLSYMQFTVVGKDTLLSITRDSTDAQWGKKRAVYRKYSETEVAVLLRYNGIHLFLNSNIKGKYQVLNSKGKPLQKWIEFCLDGSIKTNAPIFQNQRYQVGTEFYCGPRPIMSYLLFIDLTASEQYLKDTKEWITLCKQHQYGYEVKDEKMYLYELGDYFQKRNKSKLKYILEPLR